MVRCIAAVVCILSGAAVMSPGAAATGTSYAQREDVRQFIAEMAGRHGFARRDLVRLFRRAVRQPAVLRAMAPPPDAPLRSWQTYRALFVNRDRIDSGARFRELHAAALARASAEFGVPADIIVAIIGIETAYGRNTGAYRVIDALTTLAFDDPRRAEYFRSELEQYLLHARETRVDALALRGSYAGAMGIPQFMPGSYRRFAVDYDGDGRRDLNASVADAIGSVANFLGEHGWEADAATAAPAQVRGERFRTLADAGIKPLYRVADLGSFGVSVAAPLPQEAKCALIELETPGQPSEYWVGLQNFYAITRYNRSSFYAIAVIELAGAIALATPQGVMTIRIR